MVEPVGCKGWHDGLLLGIPGFISSLSHGHLIGSGGVGGGSRKPLLKNFTFLENPIRVALSWMQHYGTLQQQLLLLEGYVYTIFFTL